MSGIDVNKDVSESPPVPLEQQNPPHSVSPPAPEPPVCPPLPEESNHHGYESHATAEAVNFGLAPQYYQVPLHHPGPHAHPQFIPTPFAGPPPPPYGYYGPLPEMALRPPQASGVDPQQEVMVIVEIPSETVGSIIGKGGETIKSLMVRSGARIDVNRIPMDMSRPYRSLHCFGNIHQVQVARTLIWEKVNSIATARTNRQPALEMWIPLEMVGMIIGAKGSVIKSLQEQSGATIVVHNNHISPCNEKLLTVAGLQEQAQHARSLIEEIIANSRTGPPPQLGQPPFFNSGAIPHPQGQHQSSTIVVPNNCVGIVIGKKGETIRDLQARSAAHIKVTPDRETPADATERMITITGSLPAIEKAKSLLNDVVNEGIQRQNGSVPDIQQAMANTYISEPNGSHPHHKEQSNGATLFRPAKAIIVTLEVPNDKVGLIIGKLGVTIRELQLRSGARIVVAKEDESNKEKNIRTITLTGNHHYVDLAKSLITERMSGNVNVTFTSNIDQIPYNPNANPTSVAHPTFDPTLGYDQGAVQASPIGSHGSYEQPPHGFDHSGVYAYPQGYPYYPPSDVPYYTNGAAFSEASDAPQDTEHSTGSAKEEQKLDVAGNLTKNETPTTE